MKKQTQRSGADSDLHTGSWSEFKAVLLPGISIAFFGMGFMRFWYQYNFYNLHFSADYGHVTVGANIVRVGVIALLLFLSYKTRFSHSSRSFFAWSGLVLMTVSGAFYLVDLFFGTVQFEVARFVIGGIGLVGGEIIWVFFLQRLKPGEAFLCAAGGLALSCLLSLVAGYLSTEVMGILNLFIPVVSVIAYWQSMAVLDRRVEKEPAEDIAPVATHAEQGTCDTVYSGIDRPYIAQIVAAFILYALLIGMALGYPDGRIRELSQAVRTLHQILVIAIIAFTVWWVIVRGRGFRLSVFWSFENALMIVCIGFLMSGWPGSEEISTFFVTNAITCFYIPLVFFIYLIGRHSEKDTVLIYGIVYGGALLAMSIGRIIVYLVGPTLDHGLWLLICMAFVVLIEMVLVLRPQPSVTRPLAYELAALPVAQEDACEAESAQSAEQAGLDRLCATFGLSPLEEDIVRLIAQGRSRNVIARQLSYSENTVRNYTRNIYRKVGVHSKQELLDVIERPEVETGR